MPPPSLEARVEIVEPDTGVLLLQSPHVGIYHGDLSTLEAIRKGHPLGTVYQLERPATVVSPYPGRIGDVHVVHGQDVGYAQNLCTLVIDPELLRKAAEDLSDYVSATMPGRVVEYCVKEGDHVREGAPLVIVEAMKMEMTVSSPYAGVVGDIRRYPDGTVGAADPLVQIVREGGGPGA